MKGNYSHIKILPEEFDKSIMVTESKPLPNTSPCSLCIKSASGLASFDSNGLSDPYVRIIINKKKIAKSKIVYKNLNPVWNENFALYLKKNDFIEFKLFDFDSF
jgi:Ca2+-dependent lipid-binding protein